MVLKKIALILILLQVITSSIGGIVLLTLNEQNVLPITTNILNVLLITYGVGVLLWCFIKDFSPLFVSVYYLASILFFIINISLIYNSGVPMLNVFQSMVVGTYIDLLIESLIAFLLIKKILQKKEKLILQ